MFGKLKLLRALPLLFCKRTRKKLCIEYKFGTPERNALEEAIKKLGNLDFSVPIVMEKEHYSGDEQQLRMPYNHQQVLAKFYYANQPNILTAIQDLLAMQKKWRGVDTGKRAQIWKKCADIIEKEDRYLINAAIMLSQAKTYLQAEEDTCQLIESLRMNAEYVHKISEIKVSNSEDSKSVFSSFYMRPLDGFIIAIGPFNSLCLSANLAFCPALMGNVVMWKPAYQSVLSCFFVFQAMLKAGLPNGIINFVPANPRLFLNTAINSPYLAGVNFGGNICNFFDIWHNVCANRERFKCVPTLSAECGGNNFHFVHESANIDIVVEATARAAFEYSGQHSNSCSRMYVPKSVWSELSSALEQEVIDMKVGDPCDFTTYTSSVINEQDYDRIVAYIKYAQQSPSVETMCGGDFCKTLGYFIEPTVFVCQDPLDRLMTDHIMGPILSVFVYENNAVDEILDLIASASKYAYTGSIFATDDEVICKALKALRMTASNIYINEKCTGSSEGHTQFSGNRLSSTNDKYGTAYYLLRWTTLQLVEESFPPPKSKDDPPSQT